MRPTRGALGREASALWQDAGWTSTTCCLPRESPADYLRVADDPRLNDSVLAGSPYSFVRLAVARHQRARAAHLLRLLDVEYTDWGYKGSSASVSVEASQAA